MGALTGGAPRIGVEKFAGPFGGDGPGDGRSLSGNPAAPRPPKPSPRAASLHTVMTSARTLGFA